MIQQHECFVAIFLDSNVFAVWRVRNIPYNTALFVFSYSCIRCSVVPDNLLIIVVKPVITAILSTINLQNIQVIIKVAIYYN